MLSPRRTATNTKNPPRERASDAEPAARMAAMELGTVAREDSWGGECSRRGPRRKDGGNGPGHCRTRGSGQDFRREYDADTSGHGHNRAHEFWTVLRAKVEGN